MEPSTVFETSNPRTAVESYLDAFTRHDLPRCLDFFAEDATLSFLSGTYKGRDAIKQWHKDRFAADLKILRVDGVSASGDTVNVDLHVTSNRLRFFKISNLDGYATIQLEHGRIRQLKLGMRLFDRKATSNPPATSGVGVADYRIFVGPPDKYDVVSAMQFNLLTTLGLREHHSLLDIGCGSLRAGRLFIPYLLPERYCGIEPAKWLVEEGIRHELGDDAIRLKRPAFSHDENFTLTGFGRSFDYLIAHSIFSHAAPAQVRRCVSQARDVMTPESILAATYFEGEKSYTGSEWQYPGNVVYRFDDLRAIAGEFRLEASRLAWEHPNGQTWIVIG
ncbi:MAG TPA: nuclear transport factor 2 family protein, partial [Vicinamibacterales bacterium]